MPIQMVTTSNSLNSMRFVFLILILLAGAAFGQQLSYSPSFAAVVVANLENSSTWYQSVLKLSVKSQMNDPGGTYRITILTSDHFEMELLQLNGSLSRSSILSGKPSGTQVQGLFKIGFKVTNMDEWVKHLGSVSVTIPQIWTDSKTGKRNFLVTDPEGNLVQFFED